MRLAMIEAMKFWVTEIGIDGFRCDAADFVPFDFWKQALDSLRAIPERSLLMLAEGKRRDHFDAGFDMNYSWDFLESLRDVFVKDAPAQELFATDKAEYDTIPVGKVKTDVLPPNHDESAKMSPIKEFGDNARLYGSFRADYLSHGGALIYGFTRGRVYPGSYRTSFTYVPVDWTGNSELYQEYCRLMALYNEYPAIREGD